MRRGPLLVAFAVTCALAVAPGAPTQADPPADGTQRAAAVARVGPRVVSAGQLEDALAATPPYQLATFGSTPELARRRFLEDVMVHDALLELGARQKKLDQRLEVEFRLDRAGADATRRALRAQLGPPSAISMDDVRAYYEKNRSHFDSPERYGIWRILCKTRDDAQSVLDSSLKDATPQNFTKLARERSIDKATYLRAGNLGFVGLDGVSNEAGLRVDPALPKAAATVKDGEVVPRVVEEGENFAVVWRRGTVGASHRSVEEAQVQIRETIWKERTEAAEKKLIDDLRAREVRDVNEELLQGIDISTSDGNIVPRRRPGQVPPITQPSPSRTP